MTDERMTEDNNHLVVEIREGHPGGFEYVDRIDVTDLKSKLSLMVERNLPYERGIKERIAERLLHAGLITREEIQNMGGKILTPEHK